MTPLNRRPTDNAFVRIAGKDDLGKERLERLQRAHSQVVTMALHDDQYALIDPDLVVGAANEHPAPLASGTGYAGMTPAQRAAFLRWLDDPQQDAPPAFLSLYTAHLEMRMLEGDIWLDDVLQHLRALCTSPHWSAEPSAGRAVLLALWLQQDGSAMADWLTQAQLPASILDCGLGLQALTATPLTADELARIAAVWDLRLIAAQTRALPTFGASDEVLRMRLISLTTSLEAEPLAYALSTLGEEARRPRPWRCAHRGLRLTLPQPDVRTVLAPRLAELMAVRTQDTPMAAAPAASAARLGAKETPFLDALSHQGIILEFGVSRSEYFDYVIHQAQKLDGFSQIMDENRQLVYRVRFRKDKLRNFWRIWEYVQNWSSTHIYVDGEEIERWKVWPYSQYLR